VGFVGPYGPEQLRTSTHDHPALAARPASRAEVFEPDTAPPRRVKEILAHADARATTFGLENHNGLRQASGKSRRDT
jgi:hypothetical protein